MFARSLLLIAGFSAALDCQAALVNRWSFTVPAGSASAGTTYADTVSGTVLTVRGVGATLNGTRIALPGNTVSGTTEAEIAAYLDLPNGIASSKTNLTVEIWAAPLSAQFFQPLLDFGRMNHAGDGGGATGEWTGTTPAWPPVSETSDGIALLINRDTNLNTQRMGARINGGTPLYLDSNVATSAGTTYHYVVTFQDTVSGGTVSWYRNGVLVNTGAVPFHLSEVEDVNNWLGRSQWNILSNAHVAYDEVRIYNHAFTTAEVLASQTAGPNATFAPPVLQPDSATLHHGQKVRLNVLANDAPGSNPASVQIMQAPEHGTAVPDAGGQILYAHTSGMPADDSFTYRTNSAGGFSEPVTVMLTFATGLRIPNASLQFPLMPPPTTIGHEPAFGGLTFNAPICVASVPGDTQRLFVVERQIGVRVIPNVTAPSPSSAVFLNLAEVLAGRGNEEISDTYDQGLLSLAFHPNHAANGHFYIFYSVRIGAQEYFRVSRFTTMPGDPTVANPASELVLIQQLDTNGYHLGSDIHFGPDGYLYIALGDGGGQNDSRQVSQRIDLDFFSAIARIDVDKLPGNLEPNVHVSVPRDGGIARYSIPATNPFVPAGATVPFNGVNIPAANVRTEFYAVGLRNPWRFSFDSVTGELWCGDVGQVTSEEVNMITNGGNYGWSFREGTGAGPQMWRAPVGFVGDGPLYQYGNGTPGNYNRSITGGVVYRGTHIPELTGTYVFADYMTGDISSLRRLEGGGVEVERIAGESGIVAFGTDPSNGDVLLVDIADGMIRRLVQGSDDSGFPATLSATGLFADLTDLSPAPGLLPYTPNLSFWSDHAIKRRWFIIPDEADMSWSREGAWSYPNGMIWVKHFDLETTRGNPATAQRVETRVLVKNATGSYGVSYRWNAAGTEATLVADAGEDIAMDVMEGGVPRVQNYRIPSRSQCMACHSPQAGHALSFNTRQINRSDTIHGFTGNQIELLQAAGYFVSAPESGHLLPRHVRPEETAFTLEARARSYLAVNCASCHMAGGTAPGNWDARAHLTLAQTGLINGLAVNAGSDPLNRLIVSGDPVHSIVLNRMAATNGFTRMPPLGSNELDQPGIALIANWIQQLTARQTYEQWRQAAFGNTTDPEGAPAEDADGDGQTNEQEFLSGTPPLAGSGALIPQMVIGTNNVSINFSLPANRSFQIETSPDLTNWYLWNAPVGNAGMPHPGGAVNVTGHRWAERQFFRLNVWEN